MAQRYVLNNNLSSLNVSRNEDSTFNRTVELSNSKKDLRESSHSLSRTRSPTKLASRISKDTGKVVPIERYEELVMHYNELAKTQKILKLQRDQFSKGYNELKFISEREKAQLCQAFEQLKTNYIQVQNKYQSLAQQIKRTPSSIQKLYSQIQDKPPASSIYTMKDQYYSTLQENKTLKSSNDTLQKQLDNLRSAMDKIARQKYELINRLEGVEKDAKIKMSETNKKGIEVLRQQLHKQIKQFSSQKNQNRKNIQTTKLTLLIQQNQKLILWKQNIESYYKQQIQVLVLEIEKVYNLIKQQQQEIIRKNCTISNINTHLQAVTNQNQRIQQRSHLLQQQMNQIKSESSQIKQRASQQYKLKITQILDKAFYLSSDN